MRRYRVKVIVEGACEGEPLLIEGRISFFGEVDPVTGIIRGLSVSMANKVLVIKGTRGSTVGPYVLYSLKEHGAAPKCIIAYDIEPMLIVGCVISDIPLLKLLDPFEELSSFLRKCKKPYIVLDDVGGVVRVYEKGAPDSL